MRKSVLAAAVAASALFVTAPTAALAHGGPPSPPTVTTVTEAVAPYNLATHKGRLYVADGGTGLISRLRGSGLRTVAEAAEGTSPSGVDVSRNGRHLAFTSNEAGDPGQAEPDEKLTVLGPHGKRKVVDLGAYEAKVNPDRRVTYGVDNPSQCVRDALAAKDFPATYTGQVDSNPYSVAAWHGNSWIVADAGGNALLRVDARGRISTVAVLPRQPLVITAEMAAGLGLADCVVGITYNFEPVPTDVEVGRDGWLYVSTLAGGPEDPSLGARSSVYKVNPWSGRSYKIAGGLVGATNLALKDGKIYVAELFAGRISVIRNGRPQTFVELPAALSVESDGHNLWAGTFGPMTPEQVGSIVKISSKR